MRSPDAARAARMMMSVVSTPVTGSASGTLGAIDPVSTTGVGDAWSTIGPVEVVGAAGVVDPVLTMTAVGFGAAARGMRSRGAENSLIESVPAAIVVPFSAKAVRIVSLYDAPGVISVAVRTMADIGLIAPVIEATLIVSLVARSVIWTRRLSIWIAWLNTISKVRTSDTTIGALLIRSGVTSGVVVDVVDPVVTTEPVAAKAVSGETMIATSVTREMIGDLIEKKIRYKELKMSVRKREIKARGRRG
jgi:hypothetical protein